MYKYSVSEEESLERALGESVIDDFSDNAHRVRRNLMIFSSIALLYKLSGAEIENINIFGIAAKGISDQEILVALLAIAFYHLMHFALIALGHLEYLRIRLTRGNIKFLTGSPVGSDYEDFPSDPRHSTLYSWWTGEVKRYKKLCEVTLREDALKQLDSILNNNFQKNDSQLESYIRAHLSNIERNLGEMNKILGNKRIEESLKRFDQSFNRYRNVEKCRWLMAEIAIPLLLGIAAFIAL